ncbi:MAG: ribonuclease P protein component 4 [Candidatus Geothermarchaeales archaeon]
MRAKRRRVDKKTISREIEMLMGMALRRGRDVEMADRYVGLARGLSMRSRVRIPRDIKLFICKGCKRALIPGVTARFRVKSRREKHLVITCLRCGHVYRKIIPEKL